MTVSLFGLSWKILLRMGTTPATPPRVKPGRWSVCHVYRGNGVFCCSSSLLMSSFNLQMQSPPSVAIKSSQVWVDANIGVIHTHTHIMNECGLWCVSLPWWFIGIHLFFTTLANHPNVQSVTSFALNEWYWQISVWQTEFLHSKCVLDQHPARVFLNGGCDCWCWDGLQHLLTPWL